ATMKELMEVTTISGKFLPVSLIRRPRVPGAKAARSSRLRHRYRSKLQAQRLCQARRDFDPTGVQAVLAVARPPAVEEYGQGKKSTPHVHIKAWAVDEPVSDRKVMMLEALEPEEVALYCEEQKVMASPSHCNQVMFKELENQYGCLRGEYREYVAYLTRPDLVKGVRRLTKESEVRAVAGFTVVPRRSGDKQRKILMTCAFSYLTREVQERTT
ncbi:unnamed protein product, partial [Prorocentrum cordatum]